MWGVEQVSGGAQALYTCKLLAPSPIPSGDHCVYEPNEFSEIINHQPVPTVGVGWVSQPFATGPSLPVTAKAVKVRMVH